MAIDQLVFAWLNANDLRFVRADIFSLSYVNQSRNEKLCTISHRFPFEHSAFVPIIFPFKFLVLNHVNSCSIQIRTRMTWNQVFCLNIFVSYPNVFKFFIAICPRKVTRFLVKPKPIALVRRTFLSIDYLLPSSRLNSLRTKIHWFIWLLGKQQPNPFDFQSSQC